MRFNKFSKEMRNFEKFAMVERSFEALEDSRAEDEFYRRFEPHALVNY